MGVLQQTSVEAKAGLRLLFDSTEGSAGRVTVGASAERWPEAYYPLLKE
jgi:hypothetical protein